MLHQFRAESSFHREVIKSAKKLNIFVIQAPSLPSDEERLFALRSADKKDKKCLKPRTPNNGTEEGHNSGYKTFREIEKIGKGGFGSVYKVENTSDQRKYAVKKIKLKQQKNPESYVRKVFREVELLANLNHTNIVGYSAAWIETETEFSDPSNNLSSSDSSSEHSTGESVGTGDGRLKVTLYIQMQLCSGTLFGWLGERNDGAAVSFDAVNVDKNMKIFKGIMEGLKYIHSNGVMHRDLKPKNVFLDGDHVKIGDFGLARHVVVDQSKNTDDQHLPLDCSQHTAKVGTATYASPEQLNGSDYDSKSDMFSAGIILFELFHPFSSGMERATCIRNLKEGRMASEVRKIFPRESAMMEALLSSESTNRPSADDVLHDELFVSKDETISRLLKQLSDQTKLLRQKVQ